MQEIADASGVGRTTLYRHFPNRESLLEAVIAEIVDGAREEIAAAVAEADPELTIRSLSAASIDLALRFGRLFAASDGASPTYEAFKEDETQPGAPVPRGRPRAGGDPRRPAGWLAAERHPGGDLHGPRRDRGRDHPRRGCRAACRRHPRRDPAAAVASLRPFPARSSGPPAERPHDQPRDTDSDRRRPRLVVRRPLRGRPGLLRDRDLRRDRGALPPGGPGVLCEHHLPRAGSAGGGCDRGPRPELDRADRRRPADRADQRAGPDHRSVRRRA